jgi:peptidoglycan-associated lipoprotein
MKKVLIAVSLASLLAACSSPVKLDNVPVVDKAPTTVTPAAGGNAADGAGVAKAAVTTVDLSKNNNDSLMQLSSRVIYFDYDSFAIRQEFQSVIESHAKFIKSDKNRKVVIEGHTDERGGREYNLALGQKRAEAVRKALSLLGVPEAQIEAVSFGKEKPAVLGSTEAAMEKNRRAEISYR